MQRLSVIAMLGALAACGDPDPPRRHPERSVEYNVSVSGIVPPTAGVALMARGVEAGRFDEHTAYVQATLPGEVHLHDNPDALSLRYDTPCGPIVAPLPREFATDLEEMQARSEGNIGGDIHVNYYASPPTSLPPMARLWLDNRGGAAASITIGQLTIAIDADAARAETIALGTCPGGRAVQLGGTPLGELPPGRAGDDPAEYVLAVAGEQCYRSRGQLYAGDHAEAAVRSPPETYAGARLLAVRPVAFFLERAPDSIDGTGWAHAERLSLELFELQRVHCR